MKEYVEIFNRIWLCKSCRRHCNGFSPHPRIEFDHYLSLAVIFFERNLQSICLTRLRFGGKLQLFWGLKLERHPGFQPKTGDLYSSSTADIPECAAIK